MLVGRKQFIRALAGMGGDTPRSKRGRIVVACLVVGGLGVAAACHDSSGPEFPSDVQPLVNAVASYASFTKAETDGWSTAITDCMASAEGAMGVHYGNTALIDGALDPLRPELLIYEPGPGGTKKFVGVEFIVPFSAMPKDGPAPTLFGQTFAPNDAFGIWGLHVWTNRTNPSGLFAQWNPRVSC